MSIKQALKARKFFPNAPRHQAAIQAVRYAQAVEYLGNKWILVRQSARLSEPRPV